MKFYYNNFQQYYWITYKLIWLQFISVYAIKRLGMREVEFIRDFNSRPTLPKELQRKLQVSDSMQ